VAGGNKRRSADKAGTLSIERRAALDALGFVWDQFQADFELGLGELAEYVQAHEDARVPANYATPSGFKLGVWCGNHRRKRKLGILNDSRVSALDALGFVWDALQDGFDRGIEELAAYIQTHGDARVPAKHLTASGFKLGTWCSVRRAERRAGMLDSARAGELDALGFIWDAAQDEFGRGLTELTTYVERHGNAHVPQTYRTPAGFRLGSWCNTRRADRKAGKLSVEKIADLDALGFVWDYLRQRFDRGLEELASYVQTHGDARVPQGHPSPSGFQLGGWCQRQRAARRAGTLSAERIAELDALGFVWDPPQDEFDRGLAELAACVDTNGDARMSRAYSTPSGFKLGVWCNNHRSNRKAGTLSAERIAALDALGFVWNQLQDDFDRGVEELAAYAGTHGDTRVPQGHLTSSGFPLGNWCLNRRGDRKAGKLNAEWVAALDALGFAWDPLQEAFDRGLAELAAYISSEGDSRVPVAYSTPGGFALGSWCRVRRRERRAGKLDVARVAALDALGFVWDARQAGSDREPRRVRSGAR
jgi:hypothetical protein